MEAFKHNELDRRVYRIKRIRKELLDTYPEIGSMSMTMDIVIAKSFNGILIRTAMTNGKIIAFDPDFADSLSDVDLKKVVVHETMHKMLGHPYRITRIKTRINNSIIQQAADYSLHSQLVLDGHDIAIGGDIALVLYDEKFNHWSFERIAHHLQKEHEEEKKLVIKQIQYVQSHQCGDAEDDEEEQGGDSDEHNEGSDDESEEDNEEEAETDKGNEGKEEEDSDQDSDGERVEEDSSDNPEDDNHLSGQVWEATNEDGSPMSQEDIDKEALEVIEQVRDIHTAVSKFSGAGNTAIDSTRHLNGYTNVRKNWRSMFDNEMHKIGDKIAQDKSKYNRHLMKIGMFYPDDLKESMGWIVIAVDESGSVDNDLCSKFFDHIEKILKSTEINHISIVPFSDTIHMKRVIEIYKATKLPRVTGGWGGTRFSPIFNWINYVLKDKDYGEQEYPDLCIVFTDLGSEDYGNAPKYPVIWASSQPVFSYPSGYTNKPPFGKVIEIDY